MKTFVAMNIVPSFEKILISAMAIVFIFTVSIVVAQEFPPKHQALKATVNNAGNSVYARLAPASHPKKEDVYNVMHTEEEIVFLRSIEQNGKTTQSRIFFIRRGSENIRPLTLKNLKDEFPNNAGFHIKLDVLANNNFQLTKYRYCINRIYRNSVAADLLFKPGTIAFEKDSF